MSVGRAAGLVVPLCLAGTLALCGSNALAQGADMTLSLPAAGVDRPITLAQWGQGGGVGSGSPSDSRRIQGSGGGRTTAPGSGSPGGSIRAPQTQRFVAPSRPRIQSQTPRIQLQPQRRAPSRIVVPKRQLTPKAAPKGLVTSPRLKAASPRFKLQATRKPPASLDLVNRGLRRSPGRNKPPGIVHNPNRKAGKYGWMHRHRPFYFKHGKHRWRRHYYTVLVGGLWYWYWYDVIADADPAATVYDDTVLPDCEPDSDECIDPTLIAPAILEDRATDEAMDQCAEEFKSFNPETGTYVTNDGVVRICPYLE